MNLVNELKQLRVMLADVGKPELWETLSKSKTSSELKQNISFAVKSLQADVNRLNGNNVVSSMAQSAMGHGHARVWPNQNDPQRPRAFDWGLFRWNKKPAKLFWQREGK